jgi:hypothetical protein
VDDAVHHLQEGEHGRAEREDARPDGKIAGHLDEQPFLGRPLVVHRHRLTLRYYTKDFHRRPDSQLIAEMPSGRIDRVRRSIARLGAFMRMVTARCTPLATPVGAFGSARDGAVATRTRPDRT